jgi:hypothetical protein
MIIFKKWKNNKNKLKQKNLKNKWGENADTDVKISNISIRMIIAINKYSYYPSSACKVMSVLDYYLNLYVKLNNVIITIYKFK